MTMELRIGELVLEGLGSIDRSRLVDAMERELTRLIREHGVPDPVAGPEGSAGATRRIAEARLDSSEIRLAPAMGPEAIGARVAGAVYRAVCRQAVGQVSAAARNEPTASPGGNGEGA